LNENPNGQQMQWWGSVYNDEKILMFRHGWQKKEKERQTIGNENKFDDQHFRHGKRIKGEMLLKLMVKVF